MMIFTYQSVTNHVWLVLLGTSVTTFVLIVINTYCLKARANRSKRHAANVIDPSEGDEWDILEKQAQMVCDGSTLATAQPMHMPSHDTAQPMPSHDTSRSVSVGLAANAAKAVDPAMLEEIVDETGAVLEKLKELYKTRKFRTEFILSDPEAQI